MKTSFAMAAGIFSTLLIIGTVYAETAYADCGTSHAASDPHKMGRIATISFQDMDADKNGGVNFQEFKATFPRTRQPGFDMLDKDKDGQLNMVEWEAFKDAHKGMGSYKDKPKTT